MSTVVDRLNRLIYAKHDMNVALKECDVTAGGGLVVYPEAVSQIIPKDSPLVLYDGVKFYLSTFEEAPILDMSNVTNIDELFSNCYRLTTVKMIGDPSKITSTRYVFDNVHTSGTLYYDSRYNYGRIFQTLPDGWKSVPLDIE